MIDRSGDPAELLSANRVAALLHLRKQDVLDRIAQGDIPSVHLGRYPRVLRADLLAWLRDRTHARLPGSAPSGAPSAGNNREPRGTGNGRF